MDRMKKKIGTAALALLILWCAAPAMAQASGSSYLLPQSSYSYITDSDISGWTPQALCYARNEIYARSGMIFQSGELQDYFNSRYWYHGIYSEDQFPDSMLNVYETANVQTLLSAEEAQGGYQLDQPGYSLDSVSIYETEAAPSGNETAAAVSADPYYVDPNSYIFADSSERVLTEEEIGALSLQELCYARNEIYARHGYIFSSTELSDYFNAKNWYWGTLDASAFTDSMLNEAEAENCKALSAAEQAQGGYLTDQPGYTYSGIGSYSSSSAEVSEGDYIFYDSSSRLLTEADLAPLSLQQLCYARNEIYARRGYIFQSEELREYFGSKPWYTPTVPAESFSESVFNEVETANIAMLKSREYAINPNGYQLY